MKLKPFTQTFWGSNPNAANVREDLGSDGRVSAYKAEDPGSIPGSGRSPGEGSGYPLQYSCLDNSMPEEPGGLYSTGLQSQTRLSD